MFRSALTRLDLLESDRVDITALSKICRVVGILKRFFLGDSNLFSISQ